MTQTVKWTMPQVRYIKLNVDASFHVDRKKGATAAVLRDHQGHFVAAAGRLIPHVNSVAMAEVMAMKDGLNLANQLGCSRIEAESDSLETIEGVLVVTPGGVRVLRSLLIVWTESGV
jgi:ribonuclease HI